VSEQPPIQQQADDLAKEVHALSEQVTKLEGDEVIDDAAQARTSGLLSTLQSQVLWVVSGAFLIGAACGYVLTTAFG
jgi:hypothetical protein